MIINQTVLKVCDNSGVRYVKCFKVYTTSIGYVGSNIFASVKDIKTKSKLQKGDIVKGVIVRQRASLNRLTGNHLHFDQNEVILLNNKYEPLGTRIFGPLTLELRKKKLAKLLSLASILI